MDPNYENYGQVEDLVTEECSELIKALCKARRFGWFSRWPRDIGPTNFDVVKREMDDCVHAFGKLEAEMRKIADEHYNREEAAKAALVACAKCGARVHKGMLTEDRICHVCLDKMGHIAWAESGVVKHCAKLDPKAYGEHMFNEDGTSDCAYGCGCWMGPSRSGGPVSPFGLCPKHLLPPLEEENE